jgi:UDP-galactopyranose mutase
MHFLVVGAGFSGAVIARELAQAGHRVEVRERRPYVGGNCYTRRHGTGVMLHVHGPHIFHTDDEAVWTYIQRFAAMRPYVNRVKAVSGGRIYSLPINLHTINQFFGTTFNPQQAREFIQARADASIKDPQTFEEQALKFVGPELYRAFFAGYTAKQWGVAPSLLPASILKRLPLRFNYDDNYFAHRYQGIPEEGYTAAIERILDHPNIDLKLDVEVSPRQADSADHIFWTGPLDAWFDYAYGRLAYRTLDFETEVSQGDFQGNAVINYCDAEVPYTRVTEHKHFAPWEQHSNTLIYREYSRDCGPADTPYYPVRLSSDMQRLNQYLQSATSSKGVTFAGRLGTYRYLDMDVTIREALDIAARVLEAIESSQPLLPFYVDSG